MRSWTVVKTYWGTGDTTYRVEVWEQPWRRWAVATCYDRYTAIVFRLPGFKAFERWLYHLDKREWSLPLSNRQDDRCVYLMGKERKLLAVRQVAADSDIVKLTWPRDTT